MDDRNLRLTPTKPPDLARGMLRYMGIMFLVYVIAFLISTVLFLIIVALQSFIIRPFAPHWMPAYRFMMWLMGTTPPESYQPRPISKGKGIYLFVMGSFGMLLIIYSINLFIRTGWCAQNIFCASAIRYPFDNLLR
jgi:hypothetical protein